MTEPSELGEARKPFQTMRVSNIDVSYAEALYQQLIKMSVDIELTTLVRF